MEDPAQAGGSTTPSSPHRTKSTRIIDQESPVVDQGSEVVDQVRLHLSEGRGAVVKLERGSNGFGLLFLSPDDEPRLGRLFADYWKRTAGHPDTRVIQEWIKVSEIPTVEMVSGPQGPEIVHLGQMNTPSGQFSGQVTPPHQGDDALHRRLEEYGMQWGRHLWERGYRGPFDLDAIVSDGDLWVTETNVRRTGATYLQHLVDRLTVDSRTPVWLADSAMAANDLDFSAGVDRLASAGLAYAAGSGVVLTSDTRRIDGKWRYLVLGDDHDHIQALHRETASVLGFDRPAI